MKIVNENVKDQLTARNLRRFNHPEEDKKKLNEFIIKKKSELLYKIATDLIGLWSIIEDDDNPELSKALLKLVILDCPLTDEQLDAIYNLDPTKTEIDHQLKEALATLAIPEEHRQSTYEAIFKFRHMYFLDKPFSVRPNPLAFPERLSERALNGHYNRIALYFKQEHRQTLPKEEQQLLDLFYPEVQLRKKIVRREANLDITVEPNTIQSFIYNAAKRVFDQPSSKPIDYPTDNFDMSQPLPPQLQKQQDAYTNEPLFKLLDQPEALRTTLAEDKPPVNKINYHDRRTLLMEAVLRQDETLVKLLIDAGADVNLSDCTGYTALHLAAEGKNQTIFELILAKANTKTIDFCDQGDYTPMYIAAEAGHVNYVKALLERGADPNLQDKKWGNTVLHIAVRNNQADVVAVLLQHPKTDRFIQDKSKEKKTAEDLIKKEARLKHLTDIFSKYPHTNRLTSTNAPASTLTPTSSKTTIGNIQRALLDPVKHQALLEDFIDYSSNPFIDYTHTINPVQTEQNEPRLFAAGLAAERKRTETVKKFFQELQNELNKIVADENLRYAQIYNRLYNLFRKVKNANMPGTAFAFELTRFINHAYLRLLQQNLNPVQIAIDESDIDTIQEIYLQQPDREKEVIMVEERPVSELRYAILKQNTDVVTFILAEQQANRIKIEFIANAVNLVEQAKDPNFITRQDLVDNLPTATLNNWKNLLENLQQLLPKDQPNISGLFIQEEYELLQILLGDSGNCSTLSIPTPEDQLKLVEQRIYRSHVEFSDNSATHSAPQHATANFINELTHFTDTPETLSNHSQPLTFNLSGTYTTNANYNNLSNVVKISTADAIKKKILTESDLIFSTDVPSNHSNHIRSPIKFIGDKPNIATIFSVCQEILPSKKILKYYRFDYYEDGIEKFPFKSYAFDAQHHLFEGDSDRYFAYIFLLILKNIKGEFVSDSYYHYILKNKHNKHIINSAKDAILNNIFISGSISKPIGIDNDVIKINKNPTSNLSKNLAAEVITVINGLIADGNIERIKETVQLYSVSKYQLTFALETAVRHSKVGIIKYLLDYGVKIAAPTELAEVILSTLEYFILHNQIENNKNYISLVEILHLFFRYGSSDENDPEHIRHLVTLDLSLNFVSRKDSLLPDRAPPTILFLQRFEQTEIAEHFINGFTLELQPLYEWSFKIGLFESHLKIAKRLNKASLFGNPHISSLLKTVDDNDLLTFEKHIILNSQTPFSLAGPLFYYAIKMNNEKAIEIAIPHIKSNNTLMLTAVLVAIRYNASTFIMKVIGELALTLKFTMTFLALLLDYTLKHFDPKYTIDFLSKFSDFEKILCYFVTYKNTKLAKFIIDNFTIRTSDQSIEIIMPVIIRSENVEIFKLLLPKLFSNTENADNTFRLIIKTISNIISNPRSIYLEILLDFLKLKKLHIEFSKYILRNCNFFVLDTFVTGESILEEFFKTASPACLKILLKFMNQANQKELIKSAKDITKNFLWLAISSNHPENLTIMQQAFPDLKLITEHFNNIKLFNLLVSHSCNSIVMLEEILSRGIPFPTELQEKIVLLCIALHYGYKEIVLWLFKKKFLSHDDQDKVTKKNILQLIFDRTHNNPSPLPNQFIALLFFLVNDIGIDINHRDIDNKTLLLYPLNDIFIDFASMIPSDWTVRDSKNNTPLHIIPCNYISLELIEIFHKNGGDIKALNSDSVSILDRYSMTYNDENDENDEVNPALDLSNPTAVKTKLLEYGCPLRPAFVVSHAKTFTIACTYNKKLYLLVNSDNIFIFNEDTLTEPKAKIFSHPIPHNKDGLITVCIKNETASLPVIKKLPLKYRNDFRWVCITDSILDKKVNDENNDGEIQVKLSRFAKLLLSNYMDESNSNESELRQLNQTEFSKIYGFYKNILSGNLLKIKHDITQLPDFTKQFINHFAVTLLILKKNKNNIPYYQRLVCFSPVNAAVMSRDQGMLDYLLSVGFNHWTEDTQNPIHLAISNNNLPALNSLLQVKEQTFKQLYNYTDFLPQEEPQTVCSILEILSQQAILLHKVIISRKELRQKEFFVTYVNDFVAVTHTLYPEIDLTTLLANLNKLKAPANLGSDKPTVLKRKSKEDGDISLKPKTQRKLKSSDESSDVFTSEQQAEQPKTLFFKRSLRDTHQDTTAVNSAHKKQRPQKNGDKGLTYSRRSFE